MNRIYKIIQACDSLHIRKIFREFQGIDHHGYYPPIPGVLIRKSKRDDDDFVNGARHFYGLSMILFYVFFVGFVDFVGLDHVKPYFPPVD